MCVCCSRFCSHIHSAAQYAEFVHRPDTQPHLRGRLQTMHNVQRNANGTPARLRPTCGGVSCGRFTDMEAGPAAGLGFRFRSAQRFSERNKTRHSRTQTRRSSECDAKSRLAEVFVPRSLCALRLPMFTCATIKPILMFALRDIEERPHTLLRCTFSVNGTEPRTLSVNGTEPSIRALVVAASASSF